MNKQKSIQMMQSENHLGNKIVNENVTDLNVQEIYRKTLNLYCPLTVDSLPFPANNSFSHWVVIDSIEARRQAYMP